MSLNSVSSLFPLALGASESELEAVRTRLDTVATLRATEAGRAFLREGAAQGKDK